MTKKELWDLTEGLPDDTLIFMMLPGDDSCFTFVPPCTEESGMYEFGEPPGGYDEENPREGFVLLMQDSTRDVEEDEEEEETSQEKELLDYVSYP